MEVTKGIEMLVLTRFTGQEIQIGNDITIMMISAHSGRVRIGITAPSNVAIVRKELIPTLPVNGVTATQHELDIEDRGSSVRPPKSIRERMKLNGAEQ